MASISPATVIPRGRAVTRLDPCDPDVARDFLDFLMKSGLIDERAADRAAQVHLATLTRKEKPQRIDTVILELGLATEQAMVEVKSQYFGYPLAQPSDYPAHALHSGLFPQSFLRQCRIVPISMSDDELVIVVADPFAADSIAAIGLQMERPVRVLLGHGKDVDAAIERIFAEQANRKADIEAAGGQRGVAHEEDIQRLRDLASEAPIIRLVNRLITAAVGARASDIHLEPFVDCVRVRFRIDGILSEFERLRPDQREGVASRMKIIGKLNIAEQRMPQDGRTPFVVGGREIDLRISTAPVMHGESIVIRILDREAVDLDLATLGFDSAMQKEISRLLESPNGIMLVTGPTGSGKTTTLYSALKVLNSIERKVFTVEDPIEYQLAGVNQMQIKPLIELGFVQCLRAILRQDPDIVMIGEMRDVETIRTAIQASLTGHLVLSTLHTNSAAASITRLLDMGTEDYLLASTVTGILAQRLVRRLCGACAVPDSSFRQSLEVLDADVARFAKSLPDPNVKVPVGCPKCRNTGFHDRTTVAELLVVNQDVRSRIKRGVTDREIETFARELGMETLLQDGVRKVVRGETTLAEVLRVART